MMWTEDNEKQLKELTEKKSKFLKSFAITDALVDTLVNAKNNRVQPHISFHAKSSNPLGPLVFIDLSLEGAMASNFIECYNEYATR